MGRLLLLAMLLGVVGTPMPAPPSPGAPQPVLSVRSDLVTLAVAVADRHGMPVRGLGPEAFTVYDAHEPRPIAFFSSEELPATIGMVVDGSGSMREERARVLAAAGAFAALRHPADEFFALQFNEHVWSGLRGAAEFTSDPGELGSALASTPPRGMTALYDALSVAFEQVQRGRHARRAIIVVSDGGDNASSATLNSTLVLARTAGAPLYALALVDPDNREARPEVLRTLARETGGRVYGVAAGGGVGAAFAQLDAEIRAAYTIGFVPADSLAGGFRRIQVAARAPDGRTLTARTRAGYYAAPSR